MGDAAVITAAFLVSLKVGVIESLWTATRRLGSPSRRTLAKTRPPTLRNSAKGWFERVRLDLGLLAGSRILAGVAAGCLTGLAAWALSTTETLPSFAGLLRFLAAFSATSSALLWAYCDKQALPAHVKQYERMAAIFERADRELDRLLRSSKAPHEHDLGERILQELGQEALAENADWILLHRERPVDVPYKS